MSLACETCPVKDSAACAVLDESQREKLSRAGRVRKLKRGEMLFAKGDDNAACATLLSGALKIANFDEDGNEQILALVHPAGFIGELFAPFASYDVTALTGSELCVFARSEISTAVQSYPKLAQALLRRSEADLHSSRQLLALSGRAKAIDRVAALIRAMAQAASDSPCHPAHTFDLPLTRGEMANMLGLTIETVSRSLTKLESNGTINRKGVRGIELLDPARAWALD